MLKFDKIRKDTAIRQYCYRDIEVKLEEASGVRKVIFNKTQKQLIHYREHRKKSKGWGYPPN